jgi:hypothetical protein
VLLLLLLLLLLPKSGELQLPAVRAKAAEYSDSALQYIERRCVMPLLSVRIQHNI